MSDRRRTAITFTLAIAVGLLLVALMNASPDIIARRSLEMFSNAVVGISLGVAENPYNSLAQQIAEREGELTEREIELIASEQALKEREDRIAWKATLAVYSIGASFILFILVALNFYRDWKRPQLAVVPSQFSIRLGKK